MTSDQIDQPDVPRCIFVLDDDPDICRLVSGALREFGFETTECHTAAALRRLLLVRVPDLCIVDLGLPDADGMDVVRDLQARYACGVMVLTGRGYLSDRVMGLELGADDYIVKPFEPRELVARVRSILRRRDKNGAPSPVRSQIAEFSHAVKRPILFNTFHFPLTRFPNMPAIEADVRKFVSDNFLFGRKGVQLDADDSFLEQGLIDSTGVLELVSFIEDRFQVKVDDDELVPDNLDSINRLIQFVETKLEELK